MGKALKAVVLLVIVVGAVVAIIISVQNRGDSDAVSGSRPTLQRDNGEVVVPRTEEKYGFTTDSVGG